MGREEGLFEESVARLAGPPFMASVIELDAQKNSKGPGRDEHKVDVFLRDRAAEARFPVSRRTVDDVREAHLGRDQEAASHGGPKALKKACLRRRHEVVPRGIGQGRAGGW